MTMPTAVPTGMHRYRIHYRDEYDAANAHTTTMVAFCWEDVEHRFYAGQSDGWVITKIERIEEIA